MRWRLGYLMLFFLAFSVPLKAQIEPIPTLKVQPIPLPGGDITPPYGLYSAFTPGPPTPLLVTPPFPDYIAGHTTYAGAAEEVLEHVFGGNPGVVIKLTSATAPGVIESYATFDEIAEGVVDARVLGGIHWRTSSVRGRRVGQKVGAFAIRHFLKPKSEDSDGSSL